MRPMSFGGQKTLYPSLRGVRRRTNCHLHYLIARSRTTKQSPAGVAVLLPWRLLRRFAPRNDCKLYHFFVMHPLQ